MLIDLLEKNIEEMKQVHELEKVSNDLQKQEKNDRIYKLAIDEEYSIITAVTKGMEQLQFSVSFELKNRIEQFLEFSSEVISVGMVQETSAKNIQREVATIRKLILQEWTEYYHKIADQKISMLQAIKEIAPEKEKIDYAYNKIKAGALWDFNQDKLDKMKRGLEEADVIIENLGLGGRGDEIIEFLKKVVAGKASVKDLTPIIFNWLIDKNMTSKFGIIFR